MVGGFTFQLSPFDDQPFLRIKHLNSRSAFFRFAKPAQQEAARSQRRRGERVQFQRGNFLDVKTLAAALTSKSHSLKTLADYLGVKHKGEFTDFARPIDAEFIDYAVNDIGDDPSVLRGAGASLSQASARHDGSPRRLFGSRPR